MKDLVIFYLFFYSKQRIIVIYRLKWIGDGNSFVYNAQKKKEERKGIERDNFVFKAGPPSLLAIIHNACTFF